MMSFNIFIAVAWSSFFVGIASTHLVTPDDTPRVTAGFATNTLRQKLIKWLETILERSHIYLKPLFQLWRSAIVYSLLTEVSYSLQCALVYTYIANLKIECE
jgi:hypothetical protein